MNALYVLEPGSYLRVSGFSLKIEKDGRCLEEIPAQGLERLTLIGRCSMTGAVLDFLIKKGIETVFMSQTGKFRARLLLDAPGHVRLRQLQYKRLSDDSFCLKTAVKIVIAKIRNQKGLLLKRAYRARSSEIRGLVLQLKALERRVSKATSLDELRGIEGTAARIFYSGFGMLITNPEFSFNARNKRPPRDPVNALLSFVYTLFTNEVLNAIKACGLDPYLGALHEPASGRPSLACDLVEEWRASAENFVLTIINKRVVSMDDFVFSKKKERPVEMAPPFIRSLIRAYERNMNQQITYRDGRLEQRWVIYQRVRDFIRYLNDPSREDSLQ